MLSRGEIQTALGASRVVPLKVRNPHGPLGLEQLAAAVQQLDDRRSQKTRQIQRSISLPIETWEKLDHVARQLTQGSTRRVTASDVATSLVEQGIGGVEQTEPAG